MFDRWIATRRPRIFWLAATTILAAATITPARAVDCPGNPDALGTSRTLVVDPREHPRIGTMQYQETLPLRDHEVVLTFDDGPLPKNSNQIIDILAKECVKATFFIVGRMAHTYPAGVRKLIAAGHTVGTHSQNHPLNFQRAPIEEVRREVDEGIASTQAAAGDPALVAPFFRIPGLLRAPIVEQYLASKGIQTWSADFPADDWRHITSEKEIELAMSRLAAKGKGILLLHDIQARTVAALPTILRLMKQRGYHIVHVVPAGPGRPATPTDPEQWRLRPISENVVAVRWPRVPRYVFKPSDTLPAPALADTGIIDGLLIAPRGSFAHERLADAGAGPVQEPWALTIRTVWLAGANAVPIPAATVFAFPERTARSLQIAIRITPPEPLSSRRAPVSAVHASSDDDEIARLIQANEVASQRPIPGSIPTTRPGLSPALAPVRN